ncbi:P-loop containing nucleoside triphosphate hydrolase protein [Athelia psychrophila]|uniref:P-loop containing nucleoside triphosphate hydrolase protein n=1 Tax=Athelia psychrophila TaxID=1759441 RepID=A0A166L5T8_9AGAM|nr:P-loop containing nucleoside triphosphate hydrolase protein [Fibularhizoctonia sp. CBS 109695]
MFAELGSCRNPEGWQVVSALRAFDFTPCFEEGIIQSTLLVILLVAAIITIYFLNAAENRDRTPSSIWTLRVKIALITLATATSCANLVLIHVEHILVPIRQSYILEMVALLATIPLTYLNHKRTQTSSTLLLLFWPCYALAFAIWIRTLTSTPMSSNIKIVLILKSVVTALGLADLALECLAPEEGDPSKYKNPILTANVYSRWTFAWMTSLMRKGALEYITEHDLPNLPAEDDSAKLIDQLERAIQKQCIHLWKALFSAFGSVYCYAAFLRLVQDALSFLQPQLLRWLLSYISNYQDAQASASLDGRIKPDSSQGFAICFIMFAAATVKTIILQQYFQICSETGMRVRAGLVGKIYKKALLLSTDGRGEAGGDITNMMSIDATRLQELCAHGIIAIAGPFQIILAFVSLYKLLGWSAFVGVGIMILSIPLNAVVARLLKRLQQQQMKNRDKRTKLMSEFLANIKSIKLYAWEYTFVRKILAVRNDQEVKMLKKIGVVTSLNSAIWSGIPLLVAFSSFATAAVFSDKPLTPDVIFPAISIFMLMKFPLTMFSQVTFNIIEAWVSVDRLSRFLEADELQAEVRTIKRGSDIPEGDEVLSIKKGEFVWQREATQPTLEDINITLRKGELLGVLGRVGAGKTSLLSAIVGDMRKLDGEVLLSGSISYAPQNPWILSASIRDNILFSHEYDEEFYEMVLDACALRQDLDIFPQHDETEVGEKGLSIGGQRARISLARAVYARADIVILDDVLAAIDAHVARHVFDHVIGPHGLLSGKARILVTNSIAFLKQFDRLAFIRRGIILEDDTFENCMANEQSELRKLVEEHGTGNSSGYSTPFHRSGSQTLRLDDESTLTASSEDSPTERMSSTLASLHRRKSLRTAVLAPSLAARAPLGGMSQEHSEQGQVKQDVYMKYLQAASKTGFGFFLLFIVIQQTMSVAANLILRQWGEHNRTTGNNSGRFDYLLAYGLSLLASVFFSGAAAVVIWVFCSVRSARYLHDSMLNAVIHSPLSFFEMTPTGRILNLFSRDTYVVDQLLVRVILNLVNHMTSCASIVVVIGYSFPPFLIAVVPLAWFYRRVMKYYLATSRELKRLDSVSRSPIFAWFSETLAGLSTIRAFNQQATFTEQIERRLDRNQICYLPSNVVNRWLAMRLELAGAAIVLVSALLAITALITTGVDAGLVGLVLTYALNTTVALTWAARSASEVENNIVSVERILHYVDLKPEAPFELHDANPTEPWPSAGAVEFRQYSCRYRPELDLVLNDISVTIKPREKIGVCGRTGAGKSSLLLALFRIIEPASGSIFIDGVDVSKIGLHELRGSLSIVPQFPDLFEGTLRENIDPVTEYADVDVWAALSQASGNYGDFAHLKEYVESLPGGLDASVSEGGSSLSSGQKQLLCFARALLRKSPILVLDEATSAVDLDTDRDIQTIIRSFTETTMFTIAHRLNTIIDSDRVLVLDNGKIREFDTPQNLLADKSSVFYSMANEAGLV